MNNRILWTLTVMLLSLNAHGIEDKIIRVQNCVTSIFNKSLDLRPGSSSGGSGVSSGRNWNPGIGGGSMTIDTSPLLQIFNTCAEDYMFIQSHYKRSDGHILVSVYGGQISFGQLQDGRAEMAKLITFLNTKLLELAKPPSIEESCIDGKPHN